MPTDVICNIESRLRIRRITYSATTKGGTT